MAAKTKRDALEALICERIEREIGRQEGIPATTGLGASREKQAILTGLTRAKGIVIQAFEECR